MESTIKPRDGVRVHDDDLDDKVEAVEARFGVIPGWVGDRPRGSEVDGQAEAGAEGEQERGEEEKGDFGSVPALAEFLGAAAAAGGEHAQDCDGNWQEGQDGTMRHGQWLVFSSRREWKSTYRNVPAKRVMIRSLA